MRMAKGAGNASERENGAMKPTLLKLRRWKILQYDFHHLKQTHKPLHCFL